jgi:UDP-N-acetylmuramate dehydrogenase
MHIEENRPLAPLTTFGVGGPARWFVEAASEEEIVEACALAREQSVPLFVLGGGSNLLVADAGFDGLVLHVALRGITAAGAPSNPAARIYRAAAGEDWDTLVERAVSDGCAGIECLAGIPGTVGGTPVQNVGAYGQEVSSVIERVRAYDREEGVFIEFPAEECGFSYRRSRFNAVDRDRFIVTRVDYRLTPGGEPALRYVDLERELRTTIPLGTQPTLAQVSATVRRIRRSKGMLLVEGDADCRSAGSFFKNPLVGEDLYQQITAGSAPAPPRFPAGAGAEQGSEARVKIPAAWLIEQAGFPKGYSQGAAAVSSRHTLALTNRGGATAAEILALAEKIRTAVEARFGIRLEMEPVLVGL